MIDSPSIARVSFSVATITLMQEKKVAILGESLAPRHPLVRNAGLSGKPVSFTWIRNSESAACGVVNFIIRPEPNKKWVTQSLDLLP
jgi:putative alpha-1,2-mannosidase